MQLSLHIISSSIRLSSNLVYNIRHASEWPPVDGQQRKVDCDSQIERWMCALGGVYRRPFLERIFISVSLKTQPGWSG